MIESNLFTIPMWSIPTLNFSQKKKELEKLCNLFLKKDTECKLSQLIDKVIEVDFLKRLIVFVVKNWVCYHKNLKKTFRLKTYGQLLIKEASIIHHTIMVEQD